MEDSAITSQPLMSNIPNITVSPDAADVVTTQPSTNGQTEEERQKKKFSQFNPSPETMRKQETQNVSNDDCSWCCILCCQSTNDYEGCCDPNCCECDDCNIDCTGCCDGGDTDINGDDIAGCVECCIACAECCKD